MWTVEDDVEYGVEAALVVSSAEEVWPVEVVRTWILLVVLDGAAIEVLGTAVDVGFAVLLVNVERVDVLLLSAPEVVPPDVDG